MTVHIDFDYDPDERPPVRKFRPPPAEDDDTKIARNDQQFADQLRRDITAAGEGGWRSQYYTGSSWDLIGWMGDSQFTYRKWKLARDDWTLTGDQAYLRQLLEAVDFNCPPDALAPIVDSIGVVAISAKHRRFHPLLPTFLILFTVYAALVIGITALVTLI
jgi:hypothetical protein